MQILCIFHFRVFSILILFHSNKFYKNWINSSIFHNTLLFLTTYYCKRSCSQRELLGRGMLNAISIWLSLNAVLCRTESPCKFRNNFSFIIRMIWKMELPKTDGFPIVMPFANHLKFHRNVWHGLVKFSFNFYLATIEQIIPYNRGLCLI